MDDPNAARSEAELLQTRTRLSEVLSATRAVSFICEASVGHAAKYVSENVREMTGFPPSAFLEDPRFWVEHVHPEDRERVVAALEALPSGHLEHEYRFRCADGRYLWVQDSCRVVPTEGGKLEVIGFWVDIDARKQAEQALRRSEETFRALIENHPTAMLVRRGETVVRVNPALLRVLGYARAEELIGRDVVTLVHPDDRPDVRARIARSTGPGSLTPAEFRWIRSDGSTVVVETEALTLVLDGALHTVVFARDLTERRQLLARMSVADRMVSVGMLAAGVAHEINNPLAYLTSNLGMLLETVPRMLRGEPSGRLRLGPDEVQQLLQDAQEGANRVAAVVRDLRTLSQADAGEPGPTDACAALRAAAKTAHSLIRHRARLVDRCEPVPPVRAREGRLVQVFLNLLVNAAQAIPEGAPERNTIEVRTRAEPGGKVLVEIADSGEGIPPEVLPRIFDPFFTTKRPGEGTGLGLSICQSLVHSFGGELRVSSEPGAGTRVTVFLDVAGPEDAAAIAAQRARAPQPRGRVLVIDDEERFGTSLKLLLAPDYEVDAHTDPREALKAVARGEPYRAILCDLMMPEMTGMELFEALSRSHPEAARRVVFLTGGAVTPRSREFLASTTQPCLQKPVPADELLRAIEDAAQNAG